MLTTLPSRDISAPAWVTDTLAAVARVPVSQSPLVWAFTPYYVGNPYQAVLYNDFFDHGMVAAPAFKAPHLDAGTEGWPHDLPLVVHLHWLNQVMNRAESVDDARVAVDEHTRMLDRLQARGAKLVWTVHNVLPHDVRFEELEVELRQSVIDRADLIHIMSPRTPEMLAPWVTLPAASSGRLYQCDHPGYQGVYADWVSRDDARRKLRIPEGSTALLLTGALKPYKGMTELMAAVQEVNQGQPGTVTLIVAGAPDDAPETAEFIAQAVHEPSVRLLPAKIADGDFQVLMRAADVVALPYRRSLNSGVLALGLSFGRPAMLPSASGSLPLVDGTGAAVVYDEDDPSGLVDAVARCASLDTAASFAAAAEVGQQINRADVTARFARDMRAWADTGSLPHTFNGFSSKEAVGA